jgi:transcriptional regulator with XRE-family HTH domain
VANERLRQAIKTAGLDVDQLARAVQVDTKTVGRWLSGRVPYSRHRNRVARAIGVTERDLWPAAEIPEPAATSVELVAGFAHTADASPSWRSLLADAVERIWLLDFTLIDLLATDDTPTRLAEKARRGVEVRLLLSYATRARLATDTPVDDPYPDPEPAAVYDIARARG